MTLLKAEGLGLGGGREHPGEGAGHDRVKADFRKVALDTGGPRSQQRPRAWRSFLRTRQWLRGATSFHGQLRGHCASEAGLWQPLPICCPPPVTLFFLVPPPTQPSWSQTEGF